MADPLASTAMALASTSYENARDITPSDDADIDVPIRAIWVGVAGNVACRMHDGQDVVFSGVPVGKELRISPSRVLETGTTAAALVALW
jgi:hypothetical protein